MKVPQCLSCIFSGTVKKRQILTQSTRKELAEQLCLPKPTEKKIWSPKLNTFNTLKGLLKSLVIFFLVQACFHQSIMNFHYLKAHQVVCLTTGLKPLLHDSARADCLYFPIDTSNTLQSVGSPLCVYLLIYFTDKVLTLLQNWSYIPSYTIFSKTKISFSVQSTGKSIWQMPD